MVGDGVGAFIGDVHRKAVLTDGFSVFTAGCFSRDYSNNLETGKKLGISEDRLYKNYFEMAEKEGKREDKIDYVIIVTPNSNHYSIARIFLENGIHVACDKPVTITSDESKELKNIVLEKNLLFLVTYSNIGYPMIKQARKMVLNGEIGEIRMVMAEYAQGWIPPKIESANGQKKIWRFDPKTQGKAGVIGDIGCHIENLVSYVTGLSILSICAKLDVFGRGFELDNNASIMVKYENGASGVYWCSQIALGSKNALRLRIFGEKGSIEWEQENPEMLKIAMRGKPLSILFKGDDKTDVISRLPGGHPEGTYEAFANIYRDFGKALMCKKELRNQKKIYSDFPSIDEGIQGVRFIEKCVESQNLGSKWIEI